jgi:hypothetical protein
MPLPYPAPAGRPSRRLTLLAVIAAVGCLAVTAAVVVSVLLTGGGSGRPVAVAATPADLDAAQRALVNRLDPTALRDCRPDAKPAGSGVTAALFCATPDGHEVAVYAYQDRTALETDVATRSDAVVTTGRCERGNNEVFTWDDGPGTAEGGTVVCEHRAGRQFLFWSSDADLVAFLAYDADPRALFTWWESFQPFPDTSSAPTGAPSQQARPA